MSSRAKGNTREHALEKRLWKLGYRTMCSRASGQRKGSHRPPNALAGDVIAIAPFDSGLPHILAEVGGIGKRLGVAFAELVAEPLPAGFVPLVARCVARRWWYYLDADSRYSSLAEALDALRER